MADPKYQVIETIFNKCPVCQTGRVQHLEPNGLLGFAKSNKIICEHCQAIFIEKPKKEGENAYSLDLSASTKQNRTIGRYFSFHNILLFR